MDSPESNLVMLPFEALDGIALPSNVGLDLRPKLVWNTTAGAPHGPGMGWGVRTGISIVYDRERSSENRGMSGPRVSVGKARVTGGSGSACGDEVCGHDLGIHSNFSGA